MIGLFDQLARPVLLSLDAETAHRATILGLKHAPIPTCRADDRRLAVEAFGLKFPNPIGMAAGFDKGGEVPDALLALGFGYSEVGTITPLPQPGNPKPRLFRLPADRGVVNRFGFNSEGHDAVHRRLLARKGRPGIVGVNVGANKEAVDRIADYAAGVTKFADVASYFTINISSPNTPGLRALQTKAALDELLGRAMEAARALPAEGRVPLFLKVAPDLEDGEVEAIVESVVAHGLSGIIVSNTTISRPPLKSRHAGETGGLSGEPLRDLAQAMMGAFHQAAAGRVALIGAGGIASGADAYARIRAGASAVQLYSALVYGGPGLVVRIRRDLAARLRADGFGAVADAVGAN